MALRMVSLNRAADGRWFARKGIPADVRKEYASLYRVGREEHLKLPADTSRHEAKARLGEWEAEVETRIATLRAERNGEGQPLTKLNALALAGRWYTWFVKQYEDDPGPPKRWREMGDQLVWNVIYPEAPESYHADPKDDPHWDWQREPEVREAVRPQVAEAARVATFLASQGKALNAAAYVLFVDAVSDNFLPAITLLERRANGDYSRDDTPDAFPAFTEGRAGSSGMSCWEMFEAYVAAKRPAPQTVSRWRAVFLQMQKEFADLGASGLTEDKAQTWVSNLITEERAANTVREVWLSASRTVFAWGKRHKHISTNAFADVQVDVPKKILTRETKSFRPEEARVILRAASAYTNLTTVRDRARRWVPWLCAYSGARAGEITQLRGRDVKKLGSFYAMTLTPDAGTIKTRKPRIVPIHEHLVEQGFIVFVNAMGDGPLFYKPDTKPKPANDPLKPSRSRASTTRAHVSEWVRELGITDPELKPTHAWRHTFKQTADRAGNGLGDVGYR
jgi:integrase